MKKTLSIPRRLDASSAISFSSDLFETRDMEVVSLDFSTLRFALPSGVLFLASAIRHFVRDRQGKKTKAINVDASSNAHGYLLHIAFFRFIGLSRGNNIGEAKGSATYIPITKVDNAEIRKTARSQSRSNMEIMIEKSDQLASLLVSSHFNHSAHRAISYSIREVIRNTFEHSNSEVCYFCGQKYSSGAVEISIFDEGRGIFESLSESYNLNDESEALSIVILPGISRMKEKDKRANIFENSGFGLYVLSELGRSFGNFCLSSGSSDMMMENVTKTLDNHPNIPGTYIGLRFNSSPKSFSGTLLDIVSAGEAEALQHGEVVSASKLSRLSNDQVNSKE